jgi:two-component system, NarL family, response regulator LiaR
MTQSNRPDLRVALIDDHSIVRRGIRDYLNSQEGVTVVGEASSGEDALGVLREWQADIIIVDAHMPGGITGIETTRRIKAETPSCQVIVLSGFADDARVIGALRAGAITYLEKDSEPEELLHAVREAGAGRQALHPDLTRRVLQAEGTRYADVLTPREIDVLREVSNGLTNAEIAARLYISEETVKTHVASILRKLGLTHRTQAAVMAIRQGLV